MGAVLCHLAALRSASEFLFWDHWETAVLGQLLAGRSREVTGANFCHLAAPQPPIEFLFCDHWDMAVLGQILAGEVTGGHVTGGHVTGGYGRLQRRKTEESGGTAGKRFEKTKEYEGKSLKAAGKWRKMEETPKLNGEQRPLGFGIK